MICEFGLLCMCIGISDVFNSLAEDGILVGGMMEGGKGTEGMGRREGGRGEKKAKEEVSHI